MHFIHDCSSRGEILYARNELCNLTRHQIKIKESQELKEELQALNFLDTWSGKMEWKKEKHLVMEIHTDASTYKWGGGGNTF